MAPKKFLTAQVMPAIAWVLSLAKSITASASRSQAVSGKCFATRPAGKSTSRVEKCSVSFAPASSTGRMPVPEYTPFTQAELYGPPGLSPTTTSAPSAVSVLHSSATSAGCVTAALSGFMRETRLVFTATRIPGRTQPRPPEASIAEFSVRFIFSGA